MSGSRRWSVAALSVVGVLSLVVPAAAQAAPSPGAAPAAGTSPAAGRQAKAADDLGKRLGGAKVAADGPGGLVTFIGATTENPSFEVNSALLSRAQVYVLQALTDEELVQLVKDNVWH